MAAATPTNGFGQLITGTKEYIKQHLVYDGNKRLTDVYEARANAKDGDICLHSAYQYPDLVSTNIVGMKEYEDSWDSTWDF